MWSCKKDSIKPTKANIAGVYKLIRQEFVTGSGVTEYTKECQKDNVYSLTPDSTYRVTDEGVKCSPPGDVAGKWWLAEDKYLVIRPTYSTLSYEITQFDGKTLVLVLNNGTFLEVTHYQKQ